MRIIDDDDDNNNDDDFWKCADAVYWKLSKSVHACRNYSLLKCARFLDSVYIVTLWAWWMLPKC